jgi:DNA-binding transcriptional regulator GbsR (MarR family)
MVVRLRKDEFTAGDMNFSVRRRFRPSISYLKQFYPSGYLTAEASADIKRNKYYKESDEYFATPEQKEETKSTSEVEELKEEIKELKEEVKPNVKSRLEQLITEVEEDTKTLRAEKLLAEIEDDVRKMRKINLPESPLKRY